MVLALVLAVTLVLSQVWLSVLVGLVIPLATGVATKLNASFGLKGFITVFLSAVAGVAQTLVNNGGQITDAWVIQSLLALTSATLLFFNLYSPLKVDQKLFPNFGLGSQDPAPPNVH